MNLEGGKKDNPCLHGECTMKKSGGVKKVIKSSGVTGGGQNLGERGGEAQNDAVGPLGQEENSRQTEEDQTEVLLATRNGGGAFNREMEPAATPGGSRGKCFRNQEYLS